MPAHGGASLLDGLYYGALLALVLYNAAVWATLREVHEACIGSGASSLVTVIKVHEAAPEQPQASMESLTRKFREPGAPTDGGSGD